MADQLSDGEKGKILMDYMEEKKTNPDVTIAKYLERFAEDERDEVKKILEMGEVLSI